ncbi:Transcription termination/antitermination protein NusA [subsurface metagenome]
MKSDFLLAITQLSAEKNLPKEVVIGAVETALVSAYRKEHFAPNQNISVKLDPSVGKVEVWAEKTVVDSPSDNRCEISLAEASRFKQDALIGDTIMVEATPHNAGRIAAQTAKQVILQRLHEAEHSAIFEEYVDKESDIITGVVQRIEPKQAFINLGRTEAVLPATEQMPNERYRVGQRLKVCLVEVIRTSRGPRVVVSRCHPNLLYRLFELEIPEVFDGLVEVKSVARGAGYRSKVAVTARQEGIDPVGCCVGLRGIRIQNVVNELNGEKIDVVLWSPDTATFIANALGPVQVLRVELGEGVATVVVQDKQLSLAIGREGQNARLVAKLTGWRIDIKSASTAEAEKVAEAPPLPEVEGEAVPVDMQAASTAGIESVAEAPPLSEAEAAAALEETTAVPVLSSSSLPGEVSVEPEAAVSKPQLRFAEDIFVAGPTKPEAKSRKKKKGTQVKDKAEDGIKIKKLRRAAEISIDDEY